MSRYDTTFIVNPQIGDDTINASVNAITEIITSNEGQILRERRIGSRRLAYPIESQSHGYYVTLIHDCKPAVLPLLERHFKLGDAYLRDLTIRYDGDPFRKSITDVMMGSGSEERRPYEDRERSNDRRPRSRSGAPATASSPKVSPSVSAETIPATTAPEVTSDAGASEKSEAPVTTEPEVSAPTVNEADSAETTEEETL